MQIGGPHGIQVYGHGAQQQIRMGGVAQVPPGFPPPGPYSPPAPMPPGATPPELGRAEKEQSLTAALDEELYRNPKRLSQLFLVGAVVLGVLGSLFLTPMLAAPMVFVVGCFTAAAASMGASALVAARSRALEEKRALPLSLELALLELAHQQGGILSISQCARELKISLNDAERALSRLAKRGHAEMDVDTRGELRFRLGSAAAPRPAAALPASERKGSPAPVVPPPADSF